MDHITHQEQLDYILDLLKRKCPCNPKSLSAKFGFSEKTAQRRIEELRNRDNLDIGYN